MMPRRIVLTALAMLAAAYDATALPPTASGVLPQGSSAGFAEAREPRAFEFPRDHGPHREFRREWWYVTGNLDAANGDRFGFELTFFRFALTPSAMAVNQSMETTPAAPPGRAIAVQASAWRTHELFMAHFAVSDVARQRFRFSQKLSREALGLAGAQVEPLSIWIDDWRLSAEPGVDAVSAASAPSELAWTLHAEQEGYAVDLRLEPLSEPVLNGVAGLSRKAPDPNAASYYYSIPRLRVSGRLSRGSESLPVQGLAWLDREWGSGGLSSGQSGWDWYALQLSDGTALMFYALRDRDGRPDPYSAGTWVATTGEARRLAAPDVEIAATGSWRSRTGARYPAGWRLRVHSLALEVTVRPVLADQELETSPRYWEGAVDVSGRREGRAVEGRGYVELVGYARER
jgi:predicted secreted hydrolase